MYTKKCVEASKFTSDFGRKNADKKIDQFLIILEKKVLANFNRLNKLT